MKSFVWLNRCAQKVPCVLFLAVFCNLSVVVNAQNQGVFVVPKPQTVNQGLGVFKLTDTTNIIVQANSFNEGTKLSTFLKKATGYPFSVNTSVLTESAGDIALTILTTPNATIGDEGYLLSVKSSSITIQANTEAGLFYGWQTLRQLLPSKIEAKKAIPSFNWTIPVVEISDFPRFKWRSFMQDDSRYFFGVAATKKLLDVMAMIKLNKFHWHLVDDHGWRIEIKSRPKLQSISSVNTCSGRNSGYYTQAQITEIVNYAAALHIEVIPELEMPGHSIEVLAAYPELSCTKNNAAFGGPFAVQCAAGVNSELLCAGKEETFTFISDVIGEIAPLFPGGYIHLGGDETKSFEKWAQCKNCTARKTAQSIATDMQLKTYFMTRAAGIVASKGKQWIGWSGVETNGIPPANGILQYWETESATTSGAFTTAKAGYNTILSPYDRVYYDMRWADGEIGDTWGPAIDLSIAYGYEPMPAGLTTLQKSRILGVEGCIWSDKISAESDKEYLVAPRIFALADIDWAAPGKDFDNFQQRLHPQYERLDSLGFNYRKPDPGTSILITTQPLTSIKVDSLYGYTFYGYDAEGAPVTFSAIGLPSWLAFNASSGLLSGTPNTANQGAFQVTLRVSNGVYNVDQKFVITVGTVPTSSNLLYNADLETSGGWDLWGGNVTSTCANNGNNGIEFKDGEAGSEQVVTGLIPNTEYIFSAYINSSNSTIQLGVKNYGGNTSQINCKSTYFKPYSINFITGSGSTSATVFVYRSSGTAKVCTDDFELIPKIVAGMDNQMISNEMFHVAPNPIHEKAEITFEVKEEALVSLELYNVLGLKVGSIISSQKMTPGIYTETLQSDKISSGAYYLNLVINDLKTVKLLVIKP